MGKSTPQSPDPYTTADAQSQATIKALQESLKLSSLDQTAPWGSTTFTKNAQGLPTGQNITLGTAEQQNYDTTNAIKNSLAGNAQTLAGQLPTSLFGMPDSASDMDAVQNALYERKLGLLQPSWDQQNNQTQVQLSDRGIPIGSEIWNNELNRVGAEQGNQRLSAAQDATLAAGNEQNRQLQNAQTISNQQLNQLGSLLTGASGGQIPQFQGTASYQAQAPDIQGLIQSDYQNRINASNAANQSTSSGLFGLGSAILPFLFSERSLKKNIEQIGVTWSGIPIYKFRYTSGGPVHIGVMADEVEASIPRAVTRVGSVRMVDYGMIQ